MQYTGRKLGELVDFFSGITSSGFPRRYQSVRKVERETVHLKCNKWETVPQKGNGKPLWKRISDQLIDAYGQNRLLPATLTILQKNVCLPAAKIHWSGSPSRREPAVGRKQYCPQKRWTWILWHSCARTTVHRWRKASCSTRHIPTLEAESYIQRLGFTNFMALLWQSYLWDFKLLNFEDEDIKPIENISRQFR